MVEILLKNAKRYCTISGAKLISNPALGHGTDGSVWRTSIKTAVKVFHHERNYRDKLECYRRLRTHQITEIMGLAVPQFEDASDNLLVIEMSIVQKPYLLDFGKVYLDRSPPYYGDKQMIANWHAEVHDLFEENASKVHAILYRLQQFGIYYVDPKPANIRFE